MYIRNLRTAQPTNAADYASRDEAVAAFIAPAWAGDTAKQIAWTGDATFNWRGDRYELIDQTNPKATAATEQAARGGDLAPTDKQIALIRKPARQGIGGGSIAVRIAMLDAGKLGRKDASRLIDEMLTEARG